MFNRELGCSPQRYRLQSAELGVAMVGKGDDELRTP
jgi:hypothetical protein